MHNLDLSKVNPDNLRLYVEKPDSNFSPERNFYVIDQVLKENDEMQKKLHDTVKENAGNVADILSSFAKYKLALGGEKKIEGWLGREWMKKIYGDKLLEKIKWAEIIQKQNMHNNNTIMGGNFYLT